MMHLHRQIERLQAKARALILADDARERAERHSDREAWHFYQYMRLRASRELREAMRGLDVTRIQIEGRRVVRCAAGFRVIDGEDRRTTVAIEAVIL